MLQGMKPGIVLIYVSLGETKSVVQTAGGIDIYACLARCLASARVWTPLEPIPRLLPTHSDGFASFPWHLLKNLSIVVKKALHELYPALKKQVVTDKASAQSGTSSRRDAFPRTQTDELARLEQRLKHWKQYELIRYFSANGLS